MLEKTLENPLDSKEIKPVNPKRNQPWIFIGRTDAEAETPIHWSPDAQIQLIGKDPDAGKDWRQEEKGVTEDEMVEWHHWLNGDESEQTLVDSEGQGNLVGCSPLGYKESDTNEWLNNSNTVISVQEASWDLMWPLKTWLLYLCIELLLAVVFPQMFLVCDDLDSFQDCSGVLRTYPFGNLVFFLVIRLGLCHSFLQPRLKWWTVVPLGVP